MTKAADATTTHHAASGHELVQRWFESRGMSPWPFQSRVWDAYLAGRSGLIHVPTGAGKTYAAYGGPLSELLEEAGASPIDQTSVTTSGTPSGTASGTASGTGVPPVHNKPVSTPSGTGVPPVHNKPVSTPSGTGAPPVRSKPLKDLRILFITPLRAVSRDIEKALKAPLEDMGLLGSAITVESRTGDTSSSTRARQKTRLPNVLITTPESLTLQLSREDAEERLGSLRCVIVDEWHELLSSKRGTQTELALARLRRFSPGLRTWALSATLSNLDEAAAAAVGTAGRADLISSDIERPVNIESVLPELDEPFPWAGHLGMNQVPRVVDAIETDGDGGPLHSTLIFVNTRSQAERWHGALHAARPEWRDVLALHHGSIDREERERVEHGLKDGSVKLTVATSSLDLGVDFAPVERVFQIGSPKGIARLMQRAGRASHRPGAPCTVVCVPTNALEMVEVAAVRRALAAREIEPRTPENAPLDVLSQHMVTVALGGGFHADDLFEEVRTAHAYRDLDRRSFDWALDLVVRGGETLRAYPEYHKVAQDNDGLYRVHDKKIASLHRLNVGTITGDATMELRFINGKRIGSIEENFIQKLRAGETFVFAGRVLTYVKTQDLTAYVRPGKGQTNFTPIWSGTRLPITESLSGAVRKAIEACRDGAFHAGAEPELEAAERLVAIQRSLSRVPSAHETLAEVCKTREGYHLFMFPFEGRLVHGGLAALAALRLSRKQAGSFSIAVNDYGFELLSPDEYPFARLLARDLFTTDDLARDAVESVNLSALAKSQFREVARVAGLVFQSYPGAKRRASHVQARAGLIYDVFEQFDPENLLLHQARREVLEKQFERSRLGRTLERLSASPIALQETKRPTPLSLPLVIERVGARLSTEKILDRVAKMKKAWEHDT